MYALILKFSETSKEKMSPHFVFLWSWWSLAQYHEISHSHLVGLTSGDTEGHSMAFTLFQTQTIQWMLEWVKHSFLE